jgi:hypothetical protein
MTESEAIKILKKDSCYECAQGTDSPLNCEYGGCRVAKATRVAIQALEEVQQYRAIGIPEELQTMKEHGGFTGVELANIAAMQIKLKEYEAIGTPEEYPTAYDVDKVVAQLEELRKECEDPLKDYDPDYFIDNAIEIVKGGGVNA